MNTLLEVIRLAMNSEVQISDAWFNAIDKGTLQPEQKLKSLDLLILFQLYDLPNKKRNVEALFKNKIRSGKITEELVRKCFTVCKFIYFKDHPFIPQAKYRVLKIAIFSYILCYEFNPVLGGSETLHIRKIEVPVSLFTPGLYTLIHGTSAASVIDG